MKIIVKNTSSLQGKSQIPGSKSHSIRALLFALLAKGESVLQNILVADDTQTAQTICAVSGAEIRHETDKLYLFSKGLPLIMDTTDIHTGDSGITTLFTLPLMGLRQNFTQPVIFNCGKQMRERPIRSLIHALNHLGMAIEYLEHQDKLPISVTGKLQGGVAEVDGMNSQYLSALLISLPCAEKDSVITVKNLHERPYVSMTLDFLNQQNIFYTHHFINDVDTFMITGNQQYSARQYVIPGDFSSAACLIAAAVLLSSEVELHGLHFCALSGDKKLIPLLQTMGASIQIKNDSIHIQGGKSLNGIPIDANDVPDLIPALAVIATQAFGKTEIYNVAQARIKETDRIHSMTEGLQKMGARIEEHSDGMTIYQSHLQGACVNGYSDHRTVMALTVAGLIAEGKTMITDGESINKTYPHFIETMHSLGANVHDEIS